jgi:adenine/guanine phosphoribosyltransferase-like PRPP-binding protein
MPKDSNPTPAFSSDASGAADWTGPTTDFWQTLRAEAPDAAPPWKYRVPVCLPDGRWLDLPVRKLAGVLDGSQGGDRAVASLIANQASHEVVRALSAHMAALCRPFAPHLVIGLPTLGLMFAPPVSELLGHTRFVPLGYSRKFWYDEAFSEPVHSITSPTPGKRLYLDPNQLPLIAGRRVVVIDDAVSSGSTLVAALRLLLRARAEVTGIVVAMVQGEDWRGTLGALGEEWPGKVAGVFRSPKLKRGADGWYPLGRD